MRHSLNFSDVDVPKEYEAVVDRAMDHLQVAIGWMEMIGVPAAPMLDAILSVYTHLALNTFGEQETQKTLAKLLESIPAIMASKNLATESAGSA